MRLTYRKADKSGTSSFVWHEGELLGIVKKVEAKKTKLSDRVSRRQIAYEAHRKGKLIHTGVTMDEAAMFLYYRHRNEKREK